MKSTWIVDLNVRVKIIAFIDKSVEEMVLVNIFGHGYITNLL